MKIKILYISILFLLFGCGNDSEKEIEPIIETPIVVEPKIEKPDFNADSAYLFVQEQVDFGPRFPNNEAHGKCAKYLKHKLQSYGLNTITQIGKAKTFNNKEITIKNIIGSYNPEAEKRILLFAHWDSRPFADHDSKDLTKPILGANDGASGVGVLIEVARQLNIYKPTIGVDIIFFDAEDYGEPRGIIEDENSAKTWCLGSQYWANNMHIPNYNAEYGILLDMVGSSNAYFTQEAFSMHYAPLVVQKIWNNAKKLGYGNYFVNRQTNFVGTDDHQYVNEIAKIPSVDIIHYEQSRNGFHPSWHTHNDNMDVIDKVTLSVVGEVLLYTIYNEI
jgi:Zn-dependent M28 family amino/carboxypeptidase